MSNHRQPSFCVSERVARSGDRAAVAPHAAGRSWVLLTLVILAAVLGAALAILTSKGA
jgi:hypothetical protein